jgi:RimJ/RimL family protein N-acetyltransferase
MLRGKVAGLRARQESDTEVLHTELHDDVATSIRAASGPWRPIPVGSPGSPYALGEPSDNIAKFAIIRLADDELAGAATLWGIDTHNRLGHLGISLRPSFRGQGLGLDAVRLLCHYGFTIRGLHRLQLETLADNEPMIATALRAGFVHEGTTREAAWVDGTFTDEAIFGQLAADYTG